MRRSIVWLASASLMAAALLGGCGESEESSGNGDGAGATAPTATVAGRAATGRPIKVGFVNMEGGALSLPAIRVNAEVAARYVNEQLGGVNGRPLEYVRCDTDGSPERSLDCANKFVEADVAFVQEGVDGGSDAMLPVLRSARLPLIGHGAAGPQQQRAPNVFMLGMAGPASGIAPLKHYADEGSRSVVFVAADVPGPRQHVETNLVPAARDVGLTARTVFYGANPDWSAIAATTMADDPDVVSITGDETSCTGLIGALKSAGYGGEIFATGCTTFVEALGPQAEGVATLSDIWLPTAKDDAPPAKQEEIDVFLQAMEQAGAEREAQDGFAPRWFSDTVTLAEILRGIRGPIDGPAVSRAMRAAVDVDSFMGPAITCDGTTWPGETACGAKGLIYEATADGGQQATTDDFIDVSSFAPAG